MMTAGNTRWRLRPRALPFEELASFGRLGGKRRPKACAVRDRLRLSGLAPHRHLRRGGAPPPMVRPILQRLSDVRPAVRLLRRHGRCAGTGPTCDRRCCAASRPAADRHPDPFGCHDRFGPPQQRDAAGFLDGFGFDYEFQSSTDWYKSGRFEAALRRVRSTTTRSWR